MIWRLILVQINVEQTYYILFTLLKANTIVLSNVYASGLYIERIQLCKSSCMIAPIIQLVERKDNVLSLKKTVSIQRTYAHN